MSFPDRRKVSPEGMGQMLPVTSLLCSEIFKGTTSPPFHLCEILLKGQCHHPGCGIFQQSACCLLSNLSVKTNLFLVSNTTDLSRVKHKEHSFLMW